MHLPAFLHSFHLTSLISFVFFSLPQEDFDEFDDVDELYSSLPLDRVETLEDLVMIPPGPVKVFVSCFVQTQ